MATLAQSTVHYRGKDWPLAELARKFGRDRATLRSRLARGMTIDEALRAPLRPYPRGVKRHRESHHEPAAVPDSRVVCDRCGDDEDLQPCGLVPFLTLCHRCRVRAAAVVRRWVGCDT